MCLYIGTLVDVFLQTLTIAGAAERAFGRRLLLQRFREVKDPCPPPRRGLRASRVGMGVPPEDRGWLCFARNGALPESQQRGT